MSRADKQASSNRRPHAGSMPDAAPPAATPDTTAAPVGDTPRLGPRDRGDPPPTVSAGPGAPAPPPPPTARGGERPGDHIGPYKLLEVIGEGGFGVVWLAERRQPITQRVALKIIKPGMDTHAVIARFEQERQALAVMDHPGVARVLDAGATPAGRPFFVMEYVKGEPITTFCDRLRYSIRQRLGLLAEACEAVQHAHHKGLIHRDLKPSNVLVTLVDDRPVPKVIDFGVAKAISHTLTDKTIFTETGQLIGTPEYMSPEQAEMGRTDIDTRTDVYSLGVMLYELLAGALPFDPRELRSRGYEAMCRIIREVEPPAPSARLSRGATPPSPRVSPPSPRVSPPLSGERRQAAESPADPDRDAPHHVAQRRQTQPAHLAALLRRELEWIPLKAMRKDRARRYATPLNLAQDIRRYLAGEPLEAGPESAAYRISKWLRRYRGPASAAALVFVALLLGLAGTLWQAHRADERAAAAERAEGAARAAEGEQRRLGELESQQRIATQAAQDRAVTALKYAFQVPFYELVSAVSDRNLPANARSELESLLPSSELRSLLQSMADEISKAEERAGRAAAASPMTRFGQDECLTFARVPRALDGQGVPRRAALYELPVARALVSSAGALLELGATEKGIAVAARAELIALAGLARATTQADTDELDRELVRTELGFARACLGRFDEAEPLLLDADRSLVRVLDGDCTAQLAARISRFYADWAIADPTGGHEAQARVWADESSKRTPPFHNIASEVRSEPATRPVESRP